MKIEVIPATMEHMLEIVDKLRQVEEENLKNQNVYGMLKWAFAESRSVYAGLIDDEIAGAWGIKAGTILNDFASIWLLTTQLVDKHPLVFVRHSQIELKKLEQEFSTICGYVLSNYNLSVKWLRWLGFTLYPTRSPGVYYFEKRRA